MERGNYWESFMQQFNASATTDAARAFAISPEVIGQQVMRDSLDSVMRTLEGSKDA